MATISKTIKSSGGDYTSLSLAEASIPSSSADDFIFTYDEAFTDTTPVAFSATSFTGSINVTVAEAYRCKGAVTGTHAELTYAVNNTTHLVSVALTNVTIQHLRLVRSGTTNNVCTVLSTSAGPFTLRNNTIIMRSGGANPMVYAVDTNNVTVAGNYLIRGGANSASGLLHIQTTVAGTSKVYRNKIFQPSNSLGHYVRIRLSNTCDCQQNLALKAVGLTNTTGFSAIDGASFAAGSDHNVSSEAANAPGTNGVNSAAAATYYTTLTDGAEVLDYVTRAAMTGLGTGNDLSADAGSTDIKGNTIDAWYPGADYVDAPAAAASTGRSGFGFNFGFGFGR